ncbi:MAG: FAD-binding oxidoreductase, partial [Chlorobi bacterium]|nr:FAD-binding oxidoreductase [Chlorobiota bacterium]
MSIDNYGSFGRYPNHKPSEVKRVFWRDEIPDLSQFDKPVLPYGLGKSYGDSCQNDDGVIIDMRGLNKFISFDTEKGLFKCEAGVTLAEALKFIVPRGWFLASTPGTKLITIGGAIANDVHGKNHHKNGTFGCHVTQFELLRSSGEKLICSPEQNSELYRATIGGLGLTGLIIWAEFKVIKVTSPFIAMESIKFSGLDEFYDINDESEADFDYS